MQLINLYLLLYFIFYYQHCKEYDNDTIVQDDEIQDDRVIQDDENNESNEDGDCDDDENDPNVQNRSNAKRLKREKDSTVWIHFDIINDHPICQKCNFSFLSSTGTSTLRRHLKSVHNIVVVPKRRQKTLHEYRNDPYTESEQQERDKFVIAWIVCNAQPFSVVECEEWRQMIAKFDPRYRFHNRHTTKDQIIVLFQNKREQVKLVLSKIPEKIALTSDMWTASNNKAFLSLTIHYVDAL